MCVYLLAACRCFIMEDRGYLVAHPTLIDPKGHAPAEQQHITHKVAVSVCLPLFVPVSVCSEQGVQPFSLGLLSLCFPVSIPLSLSLSLSFVGFP